jgi:hypothetical protein
LDYPLASYVSSGSTVYGQMDRVFEATVGTRERFETASDIWLSNTPLTRRFPNPVQVVLVFEPFRLDLMANERVVRTILLGTPGGETGISGPNVAASARGCEALLQRIRSIPGLRNVEPIAERLETLQGLTTEELDGDEQLSLRSLFFFTEFLEREPALRIPRITLTPEGNIYASWREGRRVFSIHFLADGRAHYVFFAPNPGNPDLTDRVYSQTTTDQLIEQMIRLGVHGWLCN